jgi:hypothetical protein
MTFTRKLLLSGGLTAVALGLACGGGGSSTTTTAAAPGSVPLTVSDASNEDWSTIGVKILSIGLIPQGGSAATAVNVYTAPATPPVINLVQLDQLSEILGNLSVPAGTYTGAVLTLSGNPGDVSLVTSADPEAGFPLAGGTTVAPGQIQIQGTAGSAGSKTVAVTVNLVSDLVVTSGQSTALDLEFDLSHPAFIVEHLAAADLGVPFWAVNFNGPLRHHPAAIENLVLRHLYGTVTTISTDNTTLTVDKDYPTVPPVSPVTAETETTSTTAIPIQVDSTNGTLFYDLDTKTGSTITSFSTVASILTTGEFVRVAARYQQNGTLVATRIWAASTFPKVYVSPEGHVLHVNGSAATPNFVVQNELGAPVTVDVNAATEFFYRTPADGQTDAASIQGANGGITFLTSDNLVRGFKVHVGVVDPLASPLVAATVDIETARYDGTLSLPLAAGFTDTRKFNTASDDYVKTLDYISATSANGTNPTTGVAIDGFKWWDYGFPISTLETGAAAQTNFGDAIGGSVTFGGTPVINMLPWAFNFTTWNDPALANGWSVKTSILEPTQLPLGTVSTSWSASNDTFSMTLPGGTLAVPVDVNVTSGSATLVYQVDRTNGVITVTPQDVTTVTGLANAAAGLVSTNPVKVFGIPQANGSIQAYVIFYYTGTTKPTAA